jgi:steroid delta-isomerase-like uncharacterized protein
MPNPAQTRSLIEGYLDAMNHRSVAGMMERLSEDIILDPNQEQRRIGTEAFQAYHVHRFRRFRERAADLVVIVSEDGFRAAAEFTLRGEYQETEQGMPSATGQSYSIGAGAFFEIDDGRISRVTLYYNVNDLISQVGG